MAFIVMCYLEQKGLIDIRGVICNLHPSHERALLARGTFDILGMHHVPIGIGTDGGDLKDDHKDTFSETAPYMPRRISERAFSLVPGRHLLYQSLQGAKEKVTLCLISSLKDAALFLRDNERLFVDKVASVVIMGGAHPAEPGKPLRPDSAHNNQFDMPSAVFFYLRCQELKVPLTIVTRTAAYAAPVPREVYDILAQTGNVIGWRLRNAQRESIESLWKRAAAPAGDPRRRGLPDRCDGAWFKKTFCGNDPLLDERGPDDAAWDLIKAFNMYDSLALVAAVPALKQRFFTPLKHTYRGVTHEVIGASAEANGFSDTQAESLQQFLQQSYQKGLIADESQKKHVIISMQVAATWNLSDVLLGLTLLNSLLELRTIDCLGIVLGTMNRYGDVAECSKHIEPLRACLAELGLRSVPLYQQHTSLKTNVLEDLYNAAPPTGVRLLVIDSPSDVAEFMLGSKELFIKKTLEVIVVGGVTVPETEGEMMTPDYEWQCNSADKPAAEYFLKKCQEYCVPLSILSRKLPLAEPCKFPNSLYAQLAQCGKTGEWIREQQKEAIEKLWGRLKRGELPARCDEKWFARTFCGGNDDEALAVWDRVSDFTLYMAFALVIAADQLRDRFFKARGCKVRGINHHVYRDEGDIQDVEGLRHAMLQMMVKGAAMNCSHFPEEGRPGLDVDYALSDEPPEFLAAGKQLQSPCSVARVPSMIPSVSQLSETPATRRRSVM
eukprot:TRINITY_DN5548_c1_g1_i1.p1 TRINITY_DN5548_c1_g1~~TRINITY_DN5548_c1_g1_i1.p1  ORF type:complete len:785 (-),score=118.28 TRINITY_DN5548_c1_g1_i1:136-2304(-)